MLNDIIRNEKDYKVTKAWLKKALDAKKKLATLPESKEQPWLRGAQRGSMQLTIIRLSDQIKEYEAIKSGKIKLPELDNLNTIPKLLIQKRIAKGWTLQKMAKRLGMHYQQIQRYENTGYESASFSTVQKIAAVLNSKSQSPKKTRKAAACRTRTSKDRIHN